MVSCSGGVHPGDNINYQSTRSILLKNNKANILDIFVIIMERNPEGKTYIKQTGDIAILVQVL